MANQPPQGSQDLLDEYKRLRAEIDELRNERGQIWDSVPRLLKVHSAAPWDVVPPVEGADWEPYEYDPTTGEPTGSWVVWTLPPKRMSKAEKKAAPMLAVLEKRIEKKWDEIEELRLSALDRGLRLERNGQITVLQPPAAVDGPATAYITRMGDHWEIRFKGRVLRQRNSVGLQYIARLLLEPHHEYETPLRLEQAVRPSMEPQQFYGEMTQDQLHEQGLTVQGRILSRSCPRDFEALRKCDEELKEVDERIAAAEREGKKVEETRLQNQRKTILDQVADIQETMGRQRGWDVRNDRARKRIWNAMKRAIDRISRDNPELTENLLESLKPFEFPYSPSPTLVWTS